MNHVIKLVKFGGVRGLICLYMCLCFLYLNKLSKKANKRICQNWNCCLRRTLVFEVNSFQILSVIPSLLSTNE